jgi:hypothetical protein
LRSGSASNTACGEMPAACAIFCVGTAGAGLGDVIDSSNDDRVGKWLAVGSGIADGVAVADEDELLTPAMSILWKASTSIVARFALSFVFPSSSSSSSVLSSVANVFENGFAGTPLLLFRVITTVSSSVVVSSSSSTYFSSSITSAPKGSPLSSARPSSPCGSRPPILRLLSSPGLSGLSGGGLCTRTCLTIFSVLLRAASRGRSAGAVPNISSNSPPVWTCSSGAVCVVLGLGRRNGFDDIVLFPTVSFHSFYSFVNN